MDLSAYPEPYVVPPKQPPHKQTFIVLHGRGDHGRQFAGAFLWYTAGDTDKLPSRFPHAKFVFPTASPRRLSLEPRAVWNQWFDNVNLNSEVGEDVQAEGLRESSAYTHNLLRQEIDELHGDAKNVFLGGMSQGGSTVLVSALLWDGPIIGGFFGLCTRLPFGERIMRASRADQGSTKGEQSQSISVGEAGHVNRQAALRSLKTALSSADGADACSEVYLKIPMFLAHGVEDRMTWLQTGLKASESMAALGADVDWHHYADLGHDYSPDMLGDLAKFIELHSQQDSEA